MTEALAKKMSCIRDDGIDLSPLTYREPRKLSCLVCFQLITGTSLLLWLMIVEAIRAIL